MIYVPTKHMVTDKVSWTTLQLFYHNEQHQKTKNIFIARDHTQNNAQIEGYSCSITAVLRHNLEKCRKYSGVYTDTLTLRSKP